MSVYVAAVGAGHATLPRHEVSVHSALHVTFRHEPTARDAVKSVVAVLQAFEHVESAHAATQSRYVTHAASFEHAVETSQHFAFMHAVHAGEPFAPSEPRIGIAPHAALVDATSASPPSLAVSLAVSDGLASAAVSAAVSDGDVSSDASPPVAASSTAGVLELLHAICAAPSTTNTQADHDAAEAIRRIDMRQGSFPRPRGAR